MMVHLALEVSDLDETTLYCAIKEAMKDARFSNGREPDPSLSAGQFAEMASVRRSAMPNSSYPDSIICGYKPHESDGKHALEEYLRFLPSLDNYLDEARQHITCLTYGAGLLLPMTISDAASKVMRGAAIHGIDSAVNILHDFLLTQHVPTKFAFMLTGARITGEIALDAYCKLVPPSAASNLMMAIMDSGLASDLSSSQVEQVVSGVLIFDATVIPGTGSIDISSNGIHVQATRTEPKGIMGSFNEVGTLCGLLSLVSQKCVYPFMSTQILDHRIVDTLPIRQHTPFSGWSMVNHLVPIVRSNSGLEHSEVQDIGVLAQQYAACGPDTRKRLRIPLSRYVVSKSRLDAGDQYIDLGTAYEALLLSRSTRSKTKRLSQRTSWMCSGTKACHSQTYKDTKAFYKTRSDIVHGEARGGDSDLYKRAENNFIRCVKHVIKNGGVPDWSTV